MTTFEEYFRDGLPQTKALGIEVLNHGDGRAEVMLPYRGDLIGDPDTGVIAGGAVTTLLDNACGQAVHSALAELTSIATLDLRIDYMRPAAPRAGITAEAHCYKMTRSIAFVRAQAWDVDPEDPIATAQAAFILNGAPVPGAAG